MKYAICNETFQDWPFEKAFAYARSVGYTGIEIAPFTHDAPPPDFSAGARATLRGQIKDAGLECVGLHWLLAKTTGFYLTTPDEAVRKITGERLADLARGRRRSDANAPDGHRRSRTRPGRCRGPARPLTRR